MKRTKQVEQDRNPISLIGKTEQKEANVANENFKIAVTGAKGIVFYGSCSTSWQFRAWKVAWNAED